AQELIKPAHKLAFRSSQQLYLNSVLFSSAISILLGVAAFAYALFYYSYVPQIGVQRIVHLQYGDGPHPYGLVPLDNLVSRQPYDVSLTLRLPHSPPNLKMGNFMLTLALLPPMQKLASYSEKPGIFEQISPLVSFKDENIIFVSRRPVLLTYKSRLISLASRFFALPLYTLGLRTESENLLVLMGENISFLRGKKHIPGYALIEVEAGQDIQIYEVFIQFKAQFRGLRWLMYNHRIISFLFFTGLFWIVTVFFTALAWASLSNNYLDSEDLVPEIKVNSEPNISALNTDEAITEDEQDFSDTQSFHRHGAKSHKVQPKVKNEIDKDSLGPSSYIKAEENEEDDATFIGVKERAYTDSGIGTSFSESGEKAYKRRKPKVKKPNDNQLILDNM
ncbi:BgTH12-07231, partial [Blumeria graminis f. sp. triticale]